MTLGQERMLERLKANDPHPERGEIKLAKDNYGDYFYERKSSGYYESWHTNGLLKTLFDKAIGEKKEWYENGQIMSSQNYKNGRREGPYLFWHENGQLVGSSNYVNDKKRALRNSGT